MGEAGDVGCMSSYTSPALSRNGKLMTPFGVKDKPDYPPEPLACAPPSRKKGAKCSGLTP